MADYDKRVEETSVFYTGKPPTDNHASFFTRQTTKTSMLDEPGSAFSALQECAEYDTICTALTQAHIRTLGELIDWIEELDALFEVVTEALQELQPTTMPKSRLKVLKRALRNFVVRASELPTSAAGQLPTSAAGLASLVPERTDNDWDDDEAEAAVPVLTAEFDAGGHGFTEAVYADNKMLAALRLQQVANALKQGGLAKADLDALKQVNILQAEEHRHDLKWYASTY